MNYPLHEILWLHCASKRCCTVRTVVPTGADIWRIATALQVEADSFLRTIPAPDGVNDAFLLGRKREPFYAALARRSLKGRATGCTFLLHIANNTARCGLGEVRPLSCRAFPASGTAAIRCADDAHQCSCRQWTLADIDRRSASVLLRQDENEREQYGEVIRWWNESVASASADREYTFREFCRYILTTYARLASPTGGVR